MNKDYDRCLRIGDQIQRILSTVITQKIKDPRLKLVSVTEVQVSKDLRHARVFYGCIGEHSVPDLQKAMQKVSGLLTHEVSRQMQSKRIPQLQFIYDEQSAKGHDLQLLIEKAVMDDKNKSQDSYE